LIDCVALTTDHWLFHGSSRPDGRLDPIASH
jgi:hypothetical protein